MNMINEVEPKESCLSWKSFKKDLKLNAWLAVATATYLVSILLVRDNANSDWAPGLKVAVTLTPVIPGLLYLRSGLRLLKAKDELQRRIQLEAWLFAAIGTVIVSTVINVMNANGILWEDFPHGLEIGGTYLAMFFLWCIGVSLVNRRYS